MDRPKGINQIKIANSLVLSTRINKKIAYLLLSLKSHLNYNPILKRNLEVSKLLLLYLFDFFW